MKRCILLRSLVGGHGAKATAVVTFSRPVRSVVVVALFRKWRDGGGCVTNNPETFSASLANVDFL